MKSINPANGELIREYQAMSPDAAADVARRVARAADHWRTETPSHRAAALGRLETSLLEGRENFAKLMGNERDRQMRRGL